MWCITASLSIWVGVGIITSQGFGTACNCKSIELKEGVSLKVSRPNKGNKMEAQFGC